MSMSERSCVRKGAAIAGGLMLAAGGREPRRVGFDNCGMQRHADCGQFDEYGHYQILADGADLETCIEGETDCGV